MKNLLLTVALGMTGCDIKVNVQIHEPEKVKEVPSIIAIPRGFSDNDTIPAPGVTIPDGIYSHELDSGSIIKDKILIHPDTDTIDSLEPEFKME